jgi:predicted DsbA family dithiol-disulfide isomerase
VRIDIWSDFACPWCALGVHRLDAALEEFEHADAVDIVHRAFELDPRAPASRGLTMAEAVAKKYGISAAQAEAGHQHLVALGREAGIEFHFDRVQLGSTFDAHRLARAARGTGSEHALVNGLFAAHFTDGRLLSDHTVLLDVATAAGLDVDTANGVLASDAFAPDVRADEMKARDMDVTGVPHFLVNDRWPIPGAQDVETLVLVLRRAWERLEAPAT